MSVEATLIGGKLFPSYLKYWSTLTTGQIVPFAPAVDVLHIDDTSISAANVGFGFLPTPTDAVNGILSITIGTKSVTFGVPVSSPLPLAALTTTNFTFANGSLFIVGDNAIGTANDDLANTLTGGIGNDQLIGLGGNDILLGGAGNDNFILLYGAGGFENDSIDGGTGSDALIYYGSAATAASVNLSNALVRGVAAHTASNSQGAASVTSIEYVVGTTGNDLLIGGDPEHGIDSSGKTVAELFFGNAGNDTIVGGSGIGFVTLAAYSNNSALQAINANLATGIVSDGLGGTDTLVEIDVLWGGAGNDLLRGGSLSRASNGIFFEVFRGYAGNDTLDGGNASSGGAGGSSDLADYSNNASFQAINVDLTLGSVRDGWGGIDTLIDIDGVFGGAGNDTFTGGAGDDAFDGGAGYDTFDGGLGSDGVGFSSSTAGVIVNMSAQSLFISGIAVAAGTAAEGMGFRDTLISIEEVSGSNFADYIRGSDGVNTRETFSGGRGDDTIDGGAGIDFVSYSGVALVLGGVNATLANGSGSVNDKMGGTDTLMNIEGLTGTNSNDTLTGGLGDQWFRGYGGSDIIDGGDGSDWVSYLDDPIGVTINLATGTAMDGGNGVGGLLALGGTDTLISIENAEASGHNDRIIGSAVANELRGRAGNDTITGSGGIDTITGGDGNDWIEGETGNDPLPVGQIAGNDTLSGDNGDDTILAGAGDDVLHGGSGTDFLIGELGNDLAYGGNEWDAIDGRQGNDTLYG